MSKNVLVISTSLRAKSNSDELAQAFAKGAEQAGNTVEIISLKGKSVDFCRGCLACQKTQKCVISDDAVEIAEKIKHAEILVFATPVYYYGLSGQMKTLLDRCNPLFPSDYDFRDVYLLATAADEDDSAMKGSINGMQGWIDCFEKAILAGTVFAGGVNDAGEIKNHPELEQAFDMGKDV